MHRFRAPSGAMYEFDPALRVVVVPTKGHDVAPTGPVARVDDLRAVLAEYDRVATHETYLAQVREDGGGWESWASAPTAAEAAGELRHAMQDAGARDRELSAHCETLADGRTVEFDGTRFRVVRSTVDSWDATRER